MRREGVVVYPSPVALCAPASPRRGEAGSGPLTPRSRGERARVRGTTFRAGVIAFFTLAIFLAGTARAQDRPAEEEMFGGARQGETAGTATSTTTSTATDTATATATATATTTTTATSTTTHTSTPAAGAPATDSRDVLNLGNSTAGPQLSTDIAPEDPLRIGGQLYWRLMSTAGQGQNPRNWGLSAPALLDVYMDARPNERVRAFVLGRMFYDPTLPPNGTTAASSGSGTPTNVVSTSGSSVQSSDSTSANLFTQPTRGPSVLLDQLWLRFDLLHTVFVTAGKQHVRWGTARFWTPTDYLHMQPRNPLLPFDARSGVTMLKLHLPWEERGWNFYAYALPENLDATATVGKVAAASRVEVVLGSFEAGAGVFGRQNSKAKFAGDVSFGVWDLDFYGEVAVRNAADVDFVHYHGSDGTIDCSALPAGSLLSPYYSVARGAGWKPQATGGLSYTRQYADKDTFTIGAEYFYNGLGYSNVKDYLGLFALSQTMANPAAFFYLGRQYLGVFATAPAPYSWDLHSFTLSTLANLSDRSGITRLDYSYTLLTHIRFEAYGAVHWGQQHGEFRLGFNSNDLPCPPSVPIVLPPALFDIGVGLRVAI